MRGYDAVMLEQASWSFLVTLLSWCATGGILGYLGACVWGPHGKIKR